MTQYFHKQTLQYQDIVRIFVNLHDSLRDMFKFLKAETLEINRYHLYRPIGNRLSRYL